ncbi:MAG: class I SAM-dependent methyltransferase [Gammaproteobacteria bacterium]|nr:class I SAM-dependent methyltransferase [Gammaproteobacteria bacterium]
MDSECTGGHSSAQIPVASKMIDQTTHPHLSLLLSTQLECWPEHRTALTKSFQSREAEVLGTSEEIAGLIIRLSNGRGEHLRQFCSDYRYLCEEIILPEELHFRRHGAYRLTRFQDAAAQVYSNHAFMSRYINGLLLSAVLWENHARSIHLFKTHYLTTLPANSSLLEIGPGHGLLMYLAGNQTQIESLEGWDVSDASIELTRHSLAHMQAKKSPLLMRQDLFEAENLDSRVGRFDSVVVSEVLEHLERPVEALVLIRSLLKPGGTVWVNIPANSPAPDHLYLVESPEKAEELIRMAGLEVVSTNPFPMTGSTLQRAVKHRLTISCCMVCRRPA